MANSSRRARRTGLSSAVAASALIAATSIVGGPSAPANAGHVEGSYFDLDALPAPSITGKQIFDGLKDFANNHPFRVTGTPVEALATKKLCDEMTALGYDTEVHLLPQNLPGVDDCTKGQGLKAVVAIKRGTTRPNDWIIFTGHYDNVPQTIYGAYDNGSGTNLMRYLAQQFSQVPTNRSVVFVWFNGEEEGVLASDLYAKELKAANQQVSAVLGFDMVGIAWPVANPTSVNCLCLFHGADDRDAFEPLMKYVNYEFLGFPDGTREVRFVGNNSRNSDEASFEDQGYPTMRWAGMRTAANYPAYHDQDDTIETIIAQAGGESFYEQGIFNTFKSAYYTALAVDNHLPVPTASILQDGATIYVDGSGSQDEDGAISTYAWDFGDGSTADTAGADHTYAAPGIYTVTLTVTDNLWSNVTRTMSYEVTI